MIDHPNSSLPCASESEFGCRVSDLVLFMSLWNIHFIWSIRYFNRGLGAIEPTLSRFLNVRGILELIFALDSLLCHQKFVYWIKSQMRHWDDLVRGEECGMYRVPVCRVGYVWEKEEEEEVRWTTAVAKALDGHRYFFSLLSMWDIVAKRGRSSKKVDDWRFKTGW